MNLADLSKHTNAAGLVPLKFSQRFRNINAGEIAGFVPETALALLTHRGTGDGAPCVLVDVSAKDVPVADNKSPKPKAAK